MAITTSEGVKWVTGEGVYDPFGLPYERTYTADHSHFQACVFKFHNNYVQMQAGFDDQPTEPSYASGGCTSHRHQIVTIKSEDSLMESTNELHGKVSDIQRRRVCVWYSEKYHEALYVLQEDLSKNIQLIEHSETEERNNNGDNEPINELSVLNEALNECRQMRMVWHMCHTLYAVAPEGRSAQFYFWRWARENIHTTDVHETKKNIWSVVARKLVVGDIEGSIDSLESFNSSTDKETKCAIEALLPHLRAMPLMDDMMYSSRLRDWKEWSRSIQADRNNLIAISERIKVVVAILCGDDWAISPKCESWIEYAIARLMFASPEITLDRVSEHTDQWFNAKPTTTSKTDGLHTGLLNDILKAVLKKDTVTVLEKSASLSEDSLLLTAHLADILFHLGGYHMNDTLSCGLTLRQWFLMQYADQLLSQIPLDDGECRMLDMAGNYYAQCGPQGARRFALALQGIPIDSDNTGHRIIELAQEHGLVETVRYICSVQGAQCVRRNDYSAAVRWYTQGNHIRFAQRAANELLISTLQRKCSDQPLRSMRSSANRLLVDQLKSSPQLNLSDTQAKLLLRILEGGDEGNTAYPPSRNIAQALKILTEERCNTIKI